MVLAQYFNFLHFGHDGYLAIMESMKLNADHLAGRIEEMPAFDVLRPEVQLPLVAFTVAEGQPFSAHDIADQLARIRGWMVPAYALPKNAQDTVMLRILVKENLGRSLIHQLVKDLHEAVDTLEKQAAGSVDRSAEDPFRHGVLTLQPTAESQFWRLQGSSTPVSCSLATDDRGQRSSVAGPPTAAAAALRPELPALAAEIIAALRDGIPAYARPLEGPFGAGLRVGVEAALRQFVDEIGTEGPLRASPTCT